jgi:hypothetical protein
MALKEFWAGSQGPYLYDDATTYPDLVSREAFRGPQGYVEDPPTDPNHVVRLQDLGGSLPSITQNNVAASRAIDTVYQNTTNKPMFVSIGIQGTSVGSFIGRVRCSSANPPTTQVSIVEVNNTIAGSLFFLVPVGYYYKFETVSGTITILNWIEWY